MWGRTLPGHSAHLPRAAVSWLGKKFLSSVAQAASIAAVLLCRPMEANPGVRRSTQARRAALFGQATALVEREYASSITADEIAARLACSPRQLRRAFSEVGGTSLRALVTRVRMTAAAQLLISTDLPVKEISRRVGYREPGPFTKAFKQTYAATPSRYRQEQEPVETPDHTTVE